MSEKEREIHSLVEELNKASDIYYNTDNEVMDNFTWDAKYKRLKQLEKETGIQLENSPTKHVGSPVTNAGNKEKHEFAALSLDKGKDEEKFANYTKGSPAWISWKLDGATIVITYNHGRLEKILTHGDGIIGKNITHLADAFRDIPKTIATATKLIIRGEAVISYQSFENFINETESTAKNPRNLASGSLNAKNVDDIKNRGLTFRPFTLVDVDEEAIANDKNLPTFDLNSWGARLDFLEYLGFNPVEHTCFDSKIAIENKNRILDAIHSDEWDPENYDFPVDGLVITYDDVLFAKTMGEDTGHHNTYGGYALKWEDAVAETTLIGIKWSCAQTAITPVAIFEPVELEGTTVRRASLHNVSECRRLGIGGPGTKLSVIKANKIIPQIIKAETVGTTDIPKVCPVCGKPTDIKQSGNMEKGFVEVLVCTNPNCAAKSLKKFTRFVSKDGMDIEGLSETKIKDLIDSGYINSPIDLYKFDYIYQAHKNHLFLINKAKTERLYERDGWGAKSVVNLMKAVHRSRTVDKYHLLYALSIPMCGHDVSKRLLTNVSMPELIEDATEAARSDDMLRYANIENIGPEKSKAFVTWFKNDDNVKFLEELLSFLILKEDKPEEDQSEKSCEGLNFVVTGKVYQFKNRNELKAFIEKNGGSVKSSVTKNVNFLINNDTTSQSSKNKKAKDLGIKILSEDEFIKKYGAPV